MATLYDVCEKTGLSTATVSRVINGSGLVREATRERVLQAMKELNYRPSDAARRLAGRKTDTIGVVLPAIDNGYYVQVLHGIDHISTKENLKLLISFYHSGADLSEILGSLGGEGRSDAIILINNALLRPEEVRERTGNDIPIALIGQSHENTKAVDSVLINNFEGAYGAVEHLLKQKPKSLLLLTGPMENHDSQERLKGAQQAIQDAPYDPEVIILTGDFLLEGGHRIFEEHTQKRGTFPDAIFAFNDAMALGVLDVLNDAPDHVSEGIQIIGFDDIVFAQYFGLSTVRVPMQRIGEEATQLAVERIKDKNAKPNTIVLKTSLIARKTTAEQADL